MPPYDVERDLRIIEAMVEQLEPYLISSELFWPLSGPVRGGMPRLTVGGYLLRDYRLVTLPALLDSGQQTRFRAAHDLFQVTRKAWAIHYQNKMAQEWEMRQRLLEEFIRDCDNKTHDCVDYWPNQAKQRTILQHLHDEAATLEALTGQQRRALTRLDRDLRRYLQVGDGQAFFWPEELAPAYPRDVYWWLWLKPTETTT